MQKLSLNQLEAGMRLAQDVILDDGRILLLKGFTIKPRYIQSLKSYNITNIFVEDDRIPLDEISEARIYGDAFNNVKFVMESIRLDEKADISSLKDTVNDMVQHIMYDDTIFMALTGIRDIDNYTFLHCVDVCIFSVITAKTLKISHESIQELALAAILHDIGKCKVPLSILNKPGRLTESEFEIIKFHSKYGLEIVNQLPGLSRNIGRIVHQHHEKWDGSGYPSRLKGLEIELAARIISIADIYDALTANRVYRKRFMPHEAAEYILAQSGFQFDPKVVESFIDSISVYPENIMVLLNTGEIARVLPSHGVSSIRPKVSVITRKDGPPILDPYEIDLLKHPAKFVVDIIS